jgi:hypothetical protein
MTDRAQLRRFIGDYFSDDELEDLCFDYFPEVLRDFTDRMSKGQKVRLLLTYIEHRHMIELLHGALKKTRPEAYSERFRGDLSPILVQPPKPRDSDKIFICHAHADSALAHKLAGDLRAAGLSVWIAPDSIQSGEKWVSAINRGLAESGVILLLLSPEAVKSRWVREEADAAIAMENSNEARLLIARIKPVKAPPLWAARQYIPFDDDYDSGMRHLLEVLQPEKVAARNSPMPQSTSLPEPNNITPIVIPKSVPDRSSTAVGKGKFLYFALGVVVILVVFAISWRLITGSVGDRATTTATGTATIHAPTEQPMVEIAAPLPAAKVTFTQPDERDWEDTTSIWILLDFRDIREPGMQNYSLEIDSSDILRWSFSWCAVDSATLDEILIPLTVDLRVDGAKVSQENILEHAVRKSNGWMCHYWSTLMSEWLDGETIELAIDYHLDSRIFDGVNWYNSGDYRQIIKIQVR